MKRSSTVSVDCGATVSFESTDRVPQKSVHKAKVGLHSLHFLTPAEYPPSVRVRHSLAPSFIHQCRLCQRPRIIQALSPRLPLKIQIVHVNVVNLNYFRVSIYASPDKQPRMAYRSVLYSENPCQCFRHFRRPVPTAATRCPQITAMIITTATMTTATMMTPVVTTAASRTKMRRASQNVSGC